MGEIATWEKVVAVILVAGLIIFIFPGIKAQMARSKAVDKPDWAGALLPIAVVVGFVLLLISLV